MSLLTNITAKTAYNGEYDYYFALKDESATNWSKFPATTDIQANGHGITGLVYINVDGQVLDADQNTLYLNGQPLATINNLPNIGDWSQYAAIQDVDMNPSISGAPFGITGSKYYGFSQGSVLGITGPSGNSTLLLDGSAIGGTGFTGSAKYWANYPAISSVNLGGNNLGNALNITTNTLNANTLVSSPNATFTNATITNLNVSGITGITGVSDWANYPAVSSVKTAGNDINAGAGNAQQIVADGAISLLSSGGPINLSPGYNGLLNRQDVNVSGGDINITADKQAYITESSAVNITAQNGLRGLINLTANAGLNGSIPTPGTIALTANGGNFQSTSVGGLVQITANTPSPSTYTATSAIKLAASGINSYAGYNGSVGSLAGYNFVWGSLGVNLVASILGPGLLPNTPGTIYMYGDAGIVMGASVYIYNQITNYWNGVSNPLPLNLTGRTILGVDYPVNLDKIGSITFTNQQSGQINGCKQFSGNNTTMTGITTATIGTTRTDTLQSSTGTLNVSQVGSLVGKSGSTISGIGTLTSSTTRTDTLQSSTGTLNVSQVGTITGNSGSGITGFTNISAVNANFTNLNNVPVYDVVEPCKKLNGSFGAVALTIAAPLVVYTSPNLTWRWNNIDALGVNITANVGVDTSATYGFSATILVGATQYPLNTITLSAPFIANSGSFNGVNIVSASINDSFNNVITDGSTYQILLYMQVGNVSTANVTAGRVAINFTSGQDL